MAAFASLGVCILGFAHASGASLVVLALLTGVCAGLASPIVLVYAAELAPGGRTGQAVGSPGPRDRHLLRRGAGDGAVIDASGFTQAYSALGALALVAALGTLRLPRAGHRPNRQPAGDV